MNNLVFINSNNLYEEPFTTSKIIAEYGGQQHKNIRELIEKHKSDIKEFGVIAFQMLKPENFNEDIVYAFETDKPRNKGGRPEKIYKLNEQQATFLITLMKNTEKVVKFKKELVKQFYQMKNELIKRRFERSNGIEKRNVLTEALDKLPPSPHKVMKYKHYTDLVYKIVFNKNTKQLRQQYGISNKETPRDYLSTKDIKKVEKVENEIAVLIDFGNQYSNIKAMMLNKYKRN